MTTKLAFVTGMSAALSMFAVELRIVRQWEAPGLSIRFSYEPGELFVWLTHDLHAAKP